MARLRIIDFYGLKLSVSHERHAKILANYNIGIIPYNYAYMTAIKHVVRRKFGDKSFSVERAKRYLQKIIAMQRLKICKAIQNSKYKRYFVDVKSKNNGFGVYFEADSKYITAHRDEVKIFLAKVSKETNTLIY